MFPPTTLTTTTTTAAAAAAAATAAAAAAAAASATSKLTWLSNPMPSQGEGGGSLRSPPRGKCFHARLHREAVE